MSYEQERQKYRPKHVQLLFIAESPPPAPQVQSSRQFYYADRIRRDDRLFVNMMRALYADAESLSEAELEGKKQQWLERFCRDGFYMIEALTESQPHEATKKQRQQRIAEALPELIARVGEVCQPNADIILIKSNVFDVAAQPLREAGYKVLNTELVDYPGHFNQRSFRQKIQALIAQR